jgi:hypothetical protein
VRVGEIVALAVIVVVVDVIRAKLGLVVGHFVKVLGAADTDGALLIKGDALGAADSDGALVMEGEAMGKV